MQNKRPRWLKLLITLQVALDLFSGDTFAMADCHERFDQVPQLTDIATPTVLHQDRQGIIVNTLERDSQPIGNVVAEVFDQQRNVLWTLAEWRQVQMHRLEPIVEVFAERTLPHFVGKIAIGCSDDANVNFDDLRRTKPGKLTAFEHTEEFDLRADGHFADLIEEDCACVGNLEESFPLLDRTGECAFLMAEQLRFKQRLWYRSAVDTDEWCFPAWAEAVNRAREYILPRSRFTGDENGQVRRCNLEELLDRLDNQWRLPNDAVP